MRAVLNRLADLARASPHELGLVALLAAGVVAAAVLVFVRTSEPPAPEIRRVQPAPEAETEKGVLLVHVSGMVVSPGVYELPEGSRVKDAVAAAGGPLPEGNLEALNLAATVADGQKVVVPRPGEAAPEDGTDTNAKVNLNTATQAELEELPGVGPVLAQRIIEYRTTKGAFKTTRQLLEVEGFGPKKYDSIRDRITV